MHSSIKFALLFAIIPCAALATTITFDESPAPNTLNPYSATVAGATFSATNNGVWSGISQGDPGNWQLQGTNGPQFLGFNGNYDEVVTFAAAVTNVSADFSRANGSVDGTVTFQAFNGASLLGSTTADLGAINSWTTMSLAFPNITSVSWTETGTGDHPYGADNFSFGIGLTDTPEPTSAILLTSGLLCVAGLRRWRK